MAGVGQALPQEARDDTCSYEFRFARPHHIIARRLESGGSVTDKVAVVTGGGSGIGAAAAIALGPGRLAGGDRRAP